MTRNVIICKKNPC